MNEEATKAALEEWILSTTRVEKLTHIPHNQDLITHRVVDSLRFIELVYLVQELSGRSIALDVIDLRSFASINAIWKSFFV